MLHYKDGYINFEGIVVMKAFDDLNEEDLCILMKMQNGVPKYCIRGKLEQLTDEFIAGEIQFRKPYKVVNEPYTISMIKNLYEMLYNNTATPLVYDGRFKLSNK